MSSTLEAHEGGKKLSKREYEAELPRLRMDLVNLQYDLRQTDFSVLLLLMGDDRKDVNEVIDQLHEWLDARHLVTRVYMLPSRAEEGYPAYWSYWQGLPPDGRIGIHVGAWPLRALAERLLNGGTDKTLTRRIRHINALQRALIDDGTELVKVWLHLPRKAAKKRLKKAEKDPVAEPYVEAVDWRLFDKYYDALPIAERLIEETTSESAPWHIVESTHERNRDLEVGRIIRAALRARLEAPAVLRTTAVSPTRRDPVPDVLAEVDLSQKVEHESYKARLEKLQKRLSQATLAARGRVPTLLAFEGWDAAGKGGVIRRLTRAMFAQDYRVIPIAAPSDEEKARHYLWRFWRRIPRDGQVVIFDRTWYGRVLVERVEGFAEPAEWQRAYEEINDFEAQLVAHGMVFCKFWLHIDREEQLRRFEEREDTGYKKYKITEDDYRNREKWDDYVAAVNEMVARTGTPEAPWHLIAANDKKWARLSVLETVVRALERRLGET